MVSSRTVATLVALMLSVSLVAVIEVAATGAGPVWLAAVTAVVCLTGTWLGWDASKPPR